MGKKNWLLAISLALVLAIVGLAGCVSEEPPVSHGGPVTDYVSLIDNLRQAGATVEPAGEVTQPFFTVTGNIITVNGGDVQVFEYADAAAAEAEAALVSPDGSSIGTSMPFWVGPPHFYKAGRLIVLYVGDSEAVTDVLESVLGQQFAGRSGGLEDITWILESYGEQGDLQAVLEGTEITAIFDSAEGQVTGSAGCNSYFADYEASGNELSILELAWTEIGCVSPEGVMEQEQEFLSLLASAESFQTDDTTLTIESSGGQTLYFTTATRPDDQAKAAIYAAVVRQLYTVDHTFGEPPNFPIIYLVEATDDSVGDPDAPQTKSNLLLRSIQEAITASLDDLPAEFVWVGNFNEVPLDSNTGAVEGNGAIITLGNAHFRQDGSALVSASIYIANLAAGGLTYIVERIDGTWQVVGDTGVRWMA